MSKWQFFVTHAYFQKIDLMNYNKNSSWINSAIHWEIQNHPFSRPFQVMDDQPVTTCLIKLFEKYNALCEIFNLKCHTSQYYNNITFHIMINTWSLGAKVFHTQLICNYFSLCRSCSKFKFNNLWQAREHMATMN